MTERELLKQIFDICQSTSEYTPGDDDTNDSLKATLLGHEDAINKINILCDDYFAKEPEPTNEP